MNWRGPPANEFETKHAQGEVPTVADAIWLLSFDSGFDGHPGIERTSMVVCVRPGYFLTSSSRASKYAAKSFHTRLC